MDRKAHWEQVYTDKAPDEVSWHQDSPTFSLTLLREAGLTPDASVIDVGGGASNLVDHLLDRGFSDVTVLDLAGKALERARNRLGERADRVEWIEADVTGFEPERTYALWHDRAVFHFLTEPADREAYLAALRQAIPVQSFVVVATFSPEGPEKCSGLPVVRYSPEELQEELGRGFALKAVHTETHVTPQGKEQAFQGCLFQRTR